MKQDVLVCPGDLIHFTSHPYYGGIFRITQLNMCKILASLRYTGRIPKGFL